METTLGVKINPVDAERGAAAVKRAVDHIRDSARGLRGDLVDTFSSRTVLAGGLVAGLGVVSGALLSATRSAAAYIGEIKDFSQHTSVAAREASALAYAAGQNGTSVQDLQRGLERLNQNLAETVNGTGDGARLFRALGISVTETDGRLRGTNDVFLDVVDSLGRFRDDGAKSTLVAKLLGEQMQDMARAGRDAIVEQTREAEKLGLVLGERDVAAAEALDKAMDRLNKTFLGITVQVGKELIPTMTEAVDLFSHMGGGAVSGALGFVHDRLVGLNVLVKELQANSRFLFGKGQDALSFDQLQKRIDDIESEGQLKKLLFEHPTALEFMPAPRRPNDGRPALPSVGTGKERSGRPSFFDEHVEDFRTHSMDQLQLLFTGAASMRRDVQDKVERLLEDLKEDNQRTIDLITKDFAGDTPGERQEAEGRRIVERTQKEVFTREREQLIENEHAWIDYGEKVGASQEFMLQHRLDLVRLTLAKELDLTQDTAGRLLIAWQNHDDELAGRILATSEKTATQIESIQLRALGNSKQLIREHSNDVFEGWTEGMRAYMQNKDGFGMAQDMARRTAQTLEQGFDRFFFDAMEGKVRSLEDLFRGLLDMSQRIVSQVAAQVTTRAIVGAFGFRDGGIMPIERYAMGGVLPRSYQADGLPLQRYAGGGITSRPQIAIFGEGAQSEAFVPLPDGRTIPVTMKFAGALPAATPAPPVSISVPITVVNQVEGAKVQARQTAGPNGLPQIEVLITDAMKKAVADGQMDKTMSLRYGIHPNPARR